MHRGFAEGRDDAEPATQSATTELDLLRFIVCGSVDDGKSTLIGRLLYETGSVPADQLDTLAAESRRFGTQGSALDLSLLVDGLSAEREQGITIDVAYRYFSSARRKFIVIDAPGHEQYTPNMVTGASQADLGVLIVDARQGLTEQTRRHARVLRMLGVGRIVLAVNKMDRVRFLKDAFDEVVADFAAFADEEAIGEFEAVPISALTGANVTQPSTAMAWYEGPTLLGLLESVPSAARPLSATAPFRMAVQLTLRPDEDFRGFAGTVSSGRIAVGDEVVVQPGGQTSTVARIVTADGDLPTVQEGQAIVLVLADQVDCSRGDLIASGDGALSLARRFSADLVWLSEEPHRANREYVMKLATRTVPVNLAVPSPEAALELNAMRTLTLETSVDLAVDIYRADSRFGAFILIEKESQATVAAGMIGAIEARPTAAPDRPAEDIVWFDTTGHPAPAQELARIVTALSAGGARVVSVSDDDLAAEICSDLVRNSPEWAARASAVARLIARSGVTVVVATGAPPVAGSSARAIRQADAITPGWVI